MEGRKFGKVMMKRFVVCLTKGGCWGGEEFDSSEMRSLSFSADMTSLDVVISMYIFCGRVDRKIELVVLGKMIMIKRRVSKKRASKMIIA